MTTTLMRFMKAVLGDDGATALQKAAERSETLASALVPRSILAWLAFAGRWGYEGQIPGLPGSFMKFEKSGPDTFSGFIEIDGLDGPEAYEFQNATLTHLAAATAVALGADSNEIDPTIKQQDITKLGKNLDLLIGTRIVNLIKKQHEESSESSISKVAEEGGPGAAAPPRAPKEPAMAVPQAKQPAMPKPKLPSVKVTKNQAARECSVCGAAQFKQDRFEGCYCIRDLARFALVKAEPDGYLVQFRSEWSENDISVFLDMLGGE